MPGLPSACDCWSQPGRACMAALHRLWPLLSGRGWHSRHARASCDARASAGVKGANFLVSLLTSGQEISLLVHKRLEGKRSGARKSSFWDRLSRKMMRCTRKCEIACWCARRNDSRIRYILQSVPASNEQIVAWTSPLGCYFGVRNNSHRNEVGHFGLIDIEDTKLVCFCLRLDARLRYVPWFGGLFPQGVSCSG